MSGSNAAPNAFDESFLLAEALERALVNGEASRSLTAGALAELPGLLSLARRVEVSARSIVPSEEFRTTGRARLVASMHAAAESSAVRARQSGRRPARQPWGFRLALSGWFARAATALSAVALAGAATASASASALPGDPLYLIKQATEQVTLEITPENAARQHILLQQAENRLEETSRLLEQGRDAEAGQNALRYSEALERTSTTVGAAEPLEASLDADHARLVSLLADAPARARPGLQHALDTAERGLARARRTTPTEVDWSAPIATSAAAEVAPTRTAAPDDGTAQNHETVGLRAEQSRRDVPLPVVEDGHAVGAAVTPADAPTRGAPITPPERTPIRPPQRAGTSPPEHTEPVSPPQHAQPVSLPEPAQPVSPRERPVPGVPAVDNAHGGPPSQGQSEPNSHR